MKEILLTLMAMLNLGCQDLSSQYGMREVRSPNGEVFYFRREARGLNFDSLALTKSRDYCREPDPSTDIVFSGLGPVYLFYKFNGNELHLYLSVPVKVPDTFADRTKIIQHELSNPEFMFLKQNYESKGLEIADIQLDEALTCSM
jgi:hypothetical protein